MLERIQASPVYKRVTASGPYLIVQKYGADEAGSRAIVIAWTGLLSVFPLVLALHALMGVLFDDPRVAAAVQEAVVEVFPGDAAAEVTAALEEARPGAAQRGLIGLAGLVFAGSALFGAMAQGFNRVYGVPGRGLVRQRLMAIGMLLLFWVLVVASLLASGIANVLLAAVQGALPVPVPGWPRLVTGAAWGLSFLTAFVLFLAIYRVVPNANLGMREVWPGALLGAVLFFLLGQAFPLYIRYFGGFAAEYAVFGLFFLVMMWSFFLAQILVLGAVVNAVLYRPWLAQAAETAAGEPTAAAVEKPAAEPVQRKHAARSLVGAVLPWAMLAFALFLLGRPARQTGTARGAVSVLRERG